MGTSQDVNQDEVREHAALEVHTIDFREFIPSTECVRDVRHFVGEALERVGLDQDVVFECQLIADELAANAVIHAGSIFSVAIELTEVLVRIAVRDESNDPPEPHVPAARDEGGRGLVIVSGTASGWGTVLLGRGKEIWADVHLSSA
jgi:anti-sigma regulatory factor (Ser/Thr protein kinase)